MNFKIFLRNCKKAQDLKTTTTILVLVFFLLILIISFSIILRTKKSSFSNEINEERVKEAIQIAENAAKLSEIRCSFESYTKDNCIDILKLYEAGNVLTNNPQYYFGELKYSSISIYQIYPKYSKFDNNFDYGEKMYGEYKWDIYKNSLNIFDDNVNLVSIQYPVILFDGRIKAYNYGYIQINYTYEK
jgi:hypothetical protein